MNNKDFEITVMEKLTEIERRITKIETKISLITKIFYGIASIILAKLGIDISNLQ